MSSSRNDILGKVRANRAEAIDMPSLDQVWQTFDDPMERFCEVSKTTGGNCVFLSDTQAASDWFNARSSDPPGQSCVSAVDGIGTSTMQLDELDAPQTLGGLDWAILWAEFAVAENGAMWCTDVGLRHRAVYFLCEHLVLVLDRNQMLHNMHQAYDRLEGFGSDDAPPFGAFIAGPSKTADIEQSLVIGAQGPRSLDILIIG